MDAEEESDTLAELDDELDDDELDDDEADETDETGAG